MKKKVVVAFSGGLDTSFTVMYLAKEKGYEVYAACANTGGFSEEQLKQNEENAYKLGATKYVTIDVTKEYYEKSLKYMIFGNVLRNGTYPISVSSERIFQALAIARYANEIGADAIAHGSTGAGNDQIRFDMTFLVLAPNVEIITLTRDMALSREEEINYLKEHGFEADFTKLKYSYNVGLWGTSICGGEILDSAQGLPESAYLEKTGSEQLRIEFKNGEVHAVNGEVFEDNIAAIQKIEEIGAAYGIGRDMHVGDTIIGIKGRVGFEAAAPMLIIGAHRFLEKYTLSKWQQYWKDQVANWYGMFLHESQYLEPVMRDIEAMLQESQRNVNGTAILELRPLSFSTVGVESEDDLVKTKFGEYGEMQKGWTAEDAKGFIKHGGLYGETDLVFTSELPLDSIDLLFFCTAHGDTKKFMESHTVPENVKIIDLSMDYRIEGPEHDFVYGLPELNRRRICNARHIANPGCFATCIQLGVLPLAKHLMLNSDLHVNAITGSTGAGVKPSSTSHFSWRNDNISIYKPFTQQHLAEINQSLSQLEKSYSSRINFIPVRGNFSRGIFATTYIDCKIDLVEIRRIYEEYYDDHSFTFITDKNPDLKQVVNTNKCLIHLQKIDDKLLIISMIDNLLKGASGQAVHNMNLLFGLEETVGLHLKPSAF